MIEPKVFQDEYSFDDEGSEIPFEYHTKEFYIADPTYKKILWESRTLLDINELANVTQEVYIDGVARDSKSIGIANIPVFNAGIGTVMVGEDALGSGTLDDDYNETYIMRTKGNLNKKGYKMQWRFRNSVIGSKVRLKNITAKVEVLDALATNLTV